MCVLYMSWLYIYSNFVCSYTYITTDVEISHLILLIEHFKDLISIYYSIYNFIYIYIYSTVQTTVLFAYIYYNLADIVLIFFILV